VAETRWRTLAEAAEHARSSEATLRREAKRGRLRGYKIGGRRVWRFKAEDVDAWLEGRAEEPSLYDPSKQGRQR
jgi:excisionase family DNA binding protein